VVNQTGYAELDPYRLALTHALIGHLSNARGFRVLPYDRLIQIVRRFQAPGSDVSSRDAIQALTAYGGPRVVVVPTLVYDAGGWKARVEFRDAATATTTASFETPAIVSSLMKDTVYGLMTPLAAGVEDHFASIGPTRASVASRFRRAFSRDPRAGSRLATLDAQSDLARGLDAYEQQEYADALRAFSSAAQGDPRSALALAWSSRAARMMRHDQEAASTAESAVAQLTAASNRFDRLFVEAVAAEARRDVVAAEAHYRELATLAPDEPAWTLELAAFQDRLGRRADAIATHLAALSLDRNLVRPHLELCRLYNPNELAAAREHGQQALDAYRRLGVRAGEAQALWCLADIQRLGGPDDVQEARRNADAALAIFDAPGYPYNRARALNYVALTAGAQRRFSEAVSIWERALAEARAVGNEALQPLVLMNLAVADVRLGKRAEAVEYYQQSAKGFEALGQEQRAAELQANAGAILIENGGRPEQGFRDVQNALAVSRKLGNRNFEVLGAQLTAAYYRYAGRHQDAERELNRALALARERNLEDDVASLTIDIARSRLETGDYSGARTLLMQALATATGGDQTHARIRLGQALARLGDADGARRELARAEADLQRGSDAELAPLLETTAGVLDYESGNRSAARARFLRSAALWTDNFPDAASVEARAYLGLMDGLDGRADTGSMQVRSALEQAGRMGRLTLQARCHLFLARLAIARGRIDEAARELEQIQADDATRTIDAALRRETDTVRSRARGARPN
jgi:tetratricopeptide (TPR) repeat protein